MRWAPFELHIYPLLFDAAGLYTNRSCPGPAFAIAQAWLSDSVSRKPCDSLHQFTSSETTILEMCFGFTETQGDSNPRPPA